MKRILLSIFICSLAGAANEINIFSPGINAAYSVVREVDGDVWYVTGEVFEAWGTGARTADNYDISLVDKSGGMFVGNMDTNIDAGFYHIVSHYRAGANPADTDPAVWQEYGYWSGTVWQPYTLKTIEDKVDAIKAETDLIAGLNDLSAAEVNAEVDTALADYDGPTRAEATTDKDEIIVQINDNETKIDTAQADLDTITGDDGVTISSASVAAVWDAICEGAYSFKDYMRTMAAVLNGKMSGGGTTQIKVKDAATGTVDRMVTTVDAMGNRTAVTLDPD